jgi:hypothetical protein
MSSWRPPRFANHPMMNEVNLKKGSFTTCVVPSLSMLVPPFDADAWGNSPPNPALGIYHSNPFIITVYLVLQLPETDSRLADQQNK